MSDDHVYLTLAEGHEDDTRWAYGTGFEDPLHGVDTTVPEGVDAGELAAECVALADDALVSAQRLAEWVTRAPELEEEVALANIGLDLLGQARLLYSRAGQVDGTGRDEDAYAYFRDAGDFRNVTLAELPGGDFAFAIVRLLVLSSWRLAHFQQLVTHPDPVLAAVAAKGVKELTYHRQYAAEWAVRLGDGTDESHRRMRAALERVAPYLGELHAAHDAREELADVLRQVTEAAGLPLPVYRPLPGSGRAGEHTEHLVPLLTELQGVARAHPEATW
ncbi:phenylacetate-CoA oxygenase subunit PaaI [Streptomyces sp. Alain-F2R5]|jgi:ring-1,2-phenylacetyl-CoA epoxidase subunit PaaC|uniref:1,2-phenylacetyl-CoA epoxidase subunit PaaC n=1 Tax=Streptomyces TaxID=1883 RepID=UPI000BCA061C|nr:MULTISPECIES: 1,2-phenylacetyl-CoA epoxidase subunit PaaC [unclassified Streptomyces]MDN3244450.1 1,2-phenylacetyl-CoA epoxidase subunit PaaC [Streptomyces sp. ZSW22]MDN3253544.1 1,2-phenylacetyl-CoA epoxidase subunit PaaC [Streptomyces sp. MA25(2023)]MDQ0389705.1 ring-1,2-phenylacetyl-CoA epoxidase subunit PaaC [Streptomyces sp. DSM 42143]PAK27155.1 phenylacetate-CoA oxygenase subunit PaaI [Streptomyces sp. alain-838]PAN03394.1 phenylacetate-CoA oxygenase subunit PaaI [Streptomyces sp. Ala